MGESAARCTDRMAVERRRNETARLRSECWQGDPILELAEQVVRGKRKLSREQMRMLIELLPYYAPKLTAIAVGAFDGQDFYTRLDRAIERSERAKMIEARAVEIEDH